MVWFTAHLVYTIYAYNMVRVYVHMNAQCSQGCDKIKSSPRENWVIKGHSIISYRGILFIISFKWREYNSKTMI